MPSAIYPEVLVLEIEPFYMPMDLAIYRTHNLKKATKVPQVLEECKYQTRFFLQTNKFDQKYKQFGSANLHLSHSAIYQEHPNLGNARSKVCAKIRVLQNLSNVPK